MLVIAASDTNFVFATMLFEQSREPAASTGSSQAPVATRSQAQVVNDAKVMEFIKTKFVKMEQDLKDAQAELNRLKTRPRWPPNARIMCSEKWIL